MRNIFPKIIFSIGLLTSLFFVGRVFADCTPLYGGGVTCPRRGEILIDKEVRKPSEDIFVDNLTQFDPKFSPEQEVVFRIRIKNTGDQTIDSIEVKDLLPDFVSFISGPGSFNQNESKNGTLTFTVSNLVPQETREFMVRSKVFSAKDLPNDVICKLQNRAQARASDNRFNEDVSEFCVAKTPTTTKGGVVVTQVPKTGLTEGALLLTGFSSVLGAGLVIRKKAKDYLK